MNLTPQNNRAEFNITYKCNLNCVGCTHAGFLKPSTPDMTLEDAKEFFSQATDLNWKPQMTIIGGEPTLHPDVLEFVRLSVEFTGSPRLVHFFSNGYSEKSKRILQHIRDNNLCSIIENTIKEDGSVVHPMLDLFVAPVDFGDIRTEHCDAHTCCADFCGVSVDSGGYTVCPNGGVIDGFLGLGVRTKKLADLFDQEFAKKQTLALCKWCGAQSDDKYVDNPCIQQHCSGTPMSPTWLKCTEKYRK